MKTAPAHPSGAFLALEEIFSLRTIGAHPRCAALHQQRNVLRERQQILALEREATQAEIIELTASPEPRPAALRTARARLQEVERNLGELEEQLWDLSPQIAAAENAARGEVRGPLHTQARERLGAVIDAMETLLEAQTSLHALVIQAQQLGVALPVGQAFDVTLGARLQSIKVAYARLV